jgi:hypothetical protein
MDTNEHEWDTMLLHMTADMRFMASLGSFIRVNSCSFVVTNEIIP